MSVTMERFLLSGVTQGSVIEPHLFYFCINYMFSVARNSNVLLSADDIKCLVK